MILANGTIIKNRYKIINIIGKGASAVVYLAYDLDENQQIALKVQNVIEEFSNMNERFKLEAKTLRKLRHPNIVEMYDYFEWNKRRILVMEFVKGKTLNRLIKQKKQLSSADVVYYTLQILYALKEVHKLGVIHRDLKPANIVINLENKVKLMDFGIVQVSIDQNLTRQSSIIGTIQYLAPEIFRGEKATPTSEIFSVGILMYKMLTGTVPFSGFNPEETAKLILSKEPRAISRLNPDVDIELEIIVKKALEKEYYRRFRDTDSMILALKNYEEKNLNSSPKIIISSKKKKRWNVFSFLFKK